MAIRKFVREIVEGAYFVGRPIDQFSQRQGLLRPNELEYLQQHHCSYRIFYKGEWRKLIFNDRRQVVMEEKSHV